MKYLSLEQVNRILPENAVIDLSIKHLYRIVYTTVSGTYLPVATSKVTEVNRKSKIVYNTVTDFYISLGCKYVCFIVGTKGIILLPIDILKRYNNFSGWKAETKKGRQYWIRGNVEEKSIIFTNSIDYSENVDVTPYFIPYTEE